MKSDLEGLGQFGPIIVKPGYQITGKFTMNEMTNLDKKAKPCISDDSYSYNQCLRKYILGISSCNIDLPFKKFKCTQNGLELLYGTLKELRYATITKISRSTGCLPKCSINKYNFVLQESEKATWRIDWISSFHLSSKSTTYQTSVESYSYEIQVEFYESDILSLYVTPRTLLVPLVDILDCFLVGQLCQ